MSSLNGFNPPLFGGGCSSANVVELWYVFRGSRQYLAYLNGIE